MEVLRAPYKPGIVILLDKPGGKPGLWDSIAEANQIPEYGLAATQTI